MPSLEEIQKMDVVELTKAVALSSTRVEGAKLAVDLMLQKEMEFMDACLNRLKELTGGQP